MLRPIDRRIVVARVPVHGHGVFAGRGPRTVRSHAGAGRALRADADERRRGDARDRARSVADDFVIDLGSGDGRIVIARREETRRARLRRRARWRVSSTTRAAKRSGRASPIASSSARRIFSSPTSIARRCSRSYLFPRLNLHQLRPRIFAQLKPGQPRGVARVRFRQLEARRPGDVSRCRTSRTGRRVSDVFLWIVPGECRRPLAVAHAGRGGAMRCAR